MMMYDLIVVGAGAAGMMGAGQAAAAGARVLLLERNERVGRKLLITGKGRCNVTNDCGFEALIAAMRRNPRFLYSAFSVFSTQDTIAFFEGRGVPLKTERGARVFPQSDRSADIVAALEGFCRENGVTRKQHRVSDLVMQDGILSGVETVDGARYTAGAVLLATGGLSYSLTGSTGDGYRMAEKAGHTLLPTSGSLVAMVTAEPWCSELMGLSLKNVTLTLTKGDKPVFSELGEMMFTHFGISGPLVLSASSCVDGNPSGYRLSIDLKPGLNTAQLDARLLRDFEEAKNRAFQNALDRLLPRRLIPILINASGIDPRIKVNSITRAQRQKLVETFKALPLTLSALRPIEEAVVTRGGISVAEVNPKTMESKCVRGLYLAGELLDLDAVTGGFNLQIAFSTGYVAGVSAAQQRANGKG